MFICRAIATEGSQLDSLPGQLSLATSTEGTTSIHINHLPGSSSMTREGRQRLILLPQSWTFLKDHLSSEVVYGIG